MQVHDAIVSIQKQIAWRHAKINLQMILSAQSVKEEIEQYGEMEAEIEGFITRFEQKNFQK